MLKCPHCGKELVLDENGQCGHCRQKISNPETVLKNTYTPVRKAFQSLDHNTSKATFGERIKVFASIILILDIIGSFILGFGSENKNLLGFAIGLLSGAIFFAFFYGFGEIIDRLISIDEKLSNK